MSDTVEVPDQIARLSRDLAEAARMMTDDEARFLVDAYYTIQEDRKRSNNQVRALGENSEPNSVLVWFAQQNKTLEGQLQRALDRYTQGHVMGEWMRKIHGIGPVIAAGILSYIDMQRCPTAGHIWAFAGWAADGQKPWVKGQRRPFALGFRTLLYKLGESFVKFSADERCYYGHVWRTRKDFEITRNDTGLHVAEAARALENRNYSKDTDAWAWYNACYPPGTTYGRERIGREHTGTAAERSAAQIAYLKSKRVEEGKGMPMLPPAHIHARARRYAAKLFLAHLHGVWYQVEFDRPPPLPYPIQILGHAHYIPPPVPAPKPKSPPTPIADTALFDSPHTQKPRTPG
jgi:hypothetical protein